MPIGAQIGQDYPPAAVASETSLDGHTGIDRTVRTMPAPPTRRRSWLEYEHPFYAANKQRWEYALAHYTGDVIAPEHVERYLIKRTVGETKEGFRERCALADYTNHFAEVVESLAGMIFAVEPDANRIFRNETGAGLGDVNDPRTPIGRLWRRADREGNGYLTVFKRLAILLEVTHFAWVMVDSVNGRPVLRVLSPLMVTNWFEDDEGRLEVIVQEEQDARTSIRDDPKRSQRRYVHMTYQGWQRYRIDESGADVPVGGPGRWAFESPEGHPSLPIFPVELPMIRPVGYQLARKANAIFQKESERDHLLRVANFPKLIIPATDDQFDRLTRCLAEGANALQEDLERAGNTRYIAPPTDSATAASEVIKQKVLEFKATAHKAYDDGAGAQRTATEVRQDVASGTGAFLQLLKSALDDAENNALWRIEQIVYPTDRAKWFIAHVERSENFLPDDPDAVVERSASLAWGQGKTVPLGVTAQVALAKEIARYRGLPFDENELTAAVRARALTDAMESAAPTGVKLPAETRVEFLMATLTASGLVDLDADVAMADGNTEKLGDVIRRSALEQMRASDEAQRREAELLGGPGFGTNADA